MIKVPDFKRMREYIEHIPKKRDRVLIKTMYLGAFRVSEITTKVSPSDTKTHAYGRHLTWKIADFKVNRRRKEKALLITSAIAKRRLQTKKQKARGFIPKVIGIPVMPNYEPFTEELLRWGVKHWSLSFPLTRRSVHRIVKQNLRRLDPKVSPQSLRHWRLTHLVTHYQFDPYDLTAYAGWSLQHGFGVTGGMAVSPQIDAYMHSAWQKYFPKLLKPITELR
ncbi:MAG: site-specific integrase [Candidatus Bathyarchaeota archaeon]